MEQPELEKQKSAAPQKDGDSLTQPLGEVQPKPANHFDLIVTNKSTEKLFYQQVFQWNFAPEGSGGFPGYEFVNTLNQPSGGMNLPNETGNKLVLFIHVDNVQQTLNLAQSVFDGANPIGPKAHPLGGTYGFITTPNNIVLGVYADPT